MRRITMSQVRNHHHQRGSVSCCTAVSTIPVRVGSAATLIKGDHIVSFSHRILFHFPSFQEIRSIDIINQFFYVKKLG